MFGVILLLAGAVLLLAHRPISAYLHESEGARRNSFGGETRARIVVLVSGAAFGLAGLLVLAGVFDG